LFRIDGSPLRRERPGLRIFVLAPVAESFE
jgi:hypothetical protein